MEILNELAEEMKVKQNMEMKNFMAKVEKLKTRQKIEMDNLIIKVNK